MLQLSIYWQKISTFLSLSDSEEEAASKNDHASLTPKSLVATSCDPCDNNDHHTDQDTSKKQYQDTELKCFNCKATGGKLLTCSRCQFAKYCNKTCQKANFQEHKVSCCKFYYIFL